MASANGDHPSAHVDDAPPLGLRTKLAFGIGSAAETIALFYLSSYVLQSGAWIAGLDGRNGHIALLRGRRFCGPDHRIAV